MKKFTVYFIKHVTKFEMRYGSYDTRKEAEAAMQRAKSINTVDTFYISEAPGVKEFQGADALKRIFG